MAARRGMEEAKYQLDPSLPRPVPEQGRRQLTPEEQKAYRQKPWLAALLNVIPLGIGYVYLDHLGRFVKGGEKTYQRGGAKPYH